MYQAAKQVVLMAVRVVGAGGGVDSSGVTGGSGGSRGVVVSLDGGHGVVSGGRGVGVAVGVVRARSGVDTGGPFAGSGGLVEVGVGLVVGENSVVAQGVVRAGSGMHPSGVTISLAHNGDSHAGEDNLGKNQEDFVRNCSF
jgi:hypothetical protein